MHYRTFGRTSIKVSEIGQGTWSMGGDMWVGRDDQQGIHSLIRAVEMGAWFRNFYPAWD